MRKDKPPPPVVKLTARGLAPVSGYDAEELAAFPEGTEFDAVPRAARSKPQHGAYWKALTRAVESTGLWPSREALHCALKVKLGRVEPIFGLDGKVIGMRPDSTSFVAMSHREFSIFMDEAMSALSATLGYDALQWLDA